MSNDGTDVADDRDAERKDPPVWTHAALAALAATHGEHFYLASPVRFAANLGRIRAAFCAAWPRTTVAYSVKTNTLPTFLRGARDAGYAAEVVSAFEYDSATRLGFASRRIVLNGPVKMPELLVRACAGGALVHLNAAYEINPLEPLARAADTGGWRVGLRCNLGLPGHPSRFGFDVASGELDAAAHRLRAAGITPCGLHVHLSTQPRTPAAFAVRLRGLLAAADRVFPDRPPDALDVGGGFLPPGAATFDEYAGIAADELTRRYGAAGPELIVEPGAAVAFDTMQYVCRVLDVKAAGAERIAVTTGSLHTIRPSEYGLESVITVVSDGTRPGDTGVTLGGYTCMEHDILAEHFPDPVARGDFLVVSNVGAYTTALKPPFIAPTPPVLVPGPGGWERTPDPDG